MFKIININRLRRKKEKELGSRAGRGFLSRKKIREYVKVGFLLSTMLSPRPWKKMASWIQRFRKIAFSHETISWSSFDQSSRRRCCSRNDGCKEKKMLQVRCCLYDQWEKRNTWPCWILFKRDTVQGSGGSCSSPPSSVICSGVAGCWELWEARWQWLLAWIRTSA